jgi:hypothetical protein
VKEVKQQPGNAQGTSTPLVCAHAGRTQRSQLIGRSAPKRCFETFGIIDKMNNLRSKIESEIESYQFKHTTPEFAKSGLIAPKVISCIDPTNDNDEPESYTLVFIEGDGDGYQIVFDESMNQFGLAVRNESDGYTFIGNYGTFCEALDNM